MNSYGHVTERMQAEATATLERFWAHDAEPVATSDRLLHRIFNIATLAPNRGSLLENSGEGRGIRTLDQGIKSPLLYR